MESFNPKSSTFTCAQIRDFDRYAIEKLKIPGIILMENAGRVLTETLLAAIPNVIPSSRILIIAGPGNNGGDGFVMARHLQRLSYRVDVVAIGKNVSWKGDASANLSILEQLADDDLNIFFFDKDKYDDSIKELELCLSRSDVVVDAILGTGSEGAPRFPIGEIIKRVNMSHKTVFSVDIPSGLDGNSGKPAVQTIRAEITCTLAAFKKGFSDPQASAYTGKIILGDIGVAGAKLTERWQ